MNVLFILANIRKNSMLLKIAQGSGYFFISALVRIVNMEIIVGDSHFPHEI